MELLLAWIGIIICTLIAVHTNFWWRVAFWIELQFMQLEQDGHEPEDVQ